MLFSHIKKIAFGGLVCSLFAGCFSDSSSDSSDAGTIKVNMQFALQKLENLSTDAKAQLQDNGVSLTEFELSASEVEKVPEANLANTGQSTLMFKDESGAIFTITKATVNVRHIEFTPVGSVSGQDLTFEGPYVIDLLTAESNPTLANIKVPEGSYKRIDVRIDDAESKDGLLGADSPLLENSLWVEGKFSYEGKDGISYKILLKFNEDVRFESKAGIEVKAADGVNLTGSMMVANWFDGVNIISCLEKEDMEIINNMLDINDDTADGDCKDIEGIIKTNIKKSSVLQ